MLHGVESSGWCANEGLHAGMTVARFLAGEIGASQCNRRIELADDIDFLVPQRWDAGSATADAAKVPVVLRVGRDLRHRRLAYRAGDTVIWSGEPRTLLRKRRIPAPPVLSVISATCIEIIA